MDNQLINSIIEKYQFSKKQIEAVLTLLEEKNTVPFIARYAKEQTGGLDEVQIKQIDGAREHQYIESSRKT
ncbi:Tex-like N-terminal domain-containing protein [Staphylococcus aureus]